MASTLAISLRFYGLPQMHMVYGPRPRPAHLHRGVALGHAALQGYGAFHGLDDG